MTMELQIAGENAIFQRQPSDCRIIRLFYDVKLRSARDLSILDEQIALKVHPK